MFLSFFESKILLLKINFHIYFPQRQVMSKVSVEPCATCRHRLQAVNDSLVTMCF